MKAPRLTDGAVLLDGHTLDDVDAHLAGEDVEQARRFGWYPSRSTPETVRSAIEEWREQWATSGSTRTFAIRDAETSELAGGCQVRLRDNRIAEMSYWVFPPFRAGGSLLAPSSWLADGHLPSSGSSEWRSTSSRTTRRRAVRRCAPAFRRGAPPSARAAWRLAARHGSVLAPAL